MRILLTGATGRLGRVVADMLLKKNHDLRLLVRDAAKARALEKRGADVVQGPMGDAGLLHSACADIDAVVHIAASIDYLAPESDIMNANCTYTKNILEACKENGVERFVYCSSTSVYGKPRYLPVDERHPTEPFTAYGRSKLCAEKAVRESGMGHVILRPTVIYGRDFWTGFSAVFRMVKNGKMKILGSGENRIHFVHVNDCADAFLLALKTGGALGKTFNVAGREVITQSEALALVASAMGVAAPTSRVPIWVADAMARVEELKHHVLHTKPKMMREYVGVLSGDKFYDITAARDVMGFRPRVTYKEGVAEMAEGYAAAGI